MVCDTFVKWMSCRLGGLIGIHYKIEPSYADNVLKVKDEIAYHVSLNGINWTLMKEHHHTTVEESILNLLMMTHKVLFLAL